MAEIYRLDELVEFQCGLCGCNAFTIAESGEVSCDDCGAIMEDLIARQLRDDEIAP